MAEKSRFRPIRGKQANILRFIETNGIQDGDIYFAYDEGLIYFYKDGERYDLGNAAGGSGSSSFVWADAEEDIDLFKVNIDDDNDVAFTMRVTAIEGSTAENPKYPAEGLLVINSDGRFFRVTGQSASDMIVYMDLIAVSGTGGGGGGGVTGDLFLTLGNELYEGAVFLYGQSKNISLVASSWPWSKLFFC